MTLECGIPVGSLHCKSQIDVACIHLAFDWEDQCWCGS